MDVKEKNRVVCLEYALKSVEDIIDTFSDSLSNSLHRKKKMENYTDTAMFVLGYEEAVPVVKTTEVRSSEKSESGSLIHDRGLKKSPLQKAESVLKKKLIAETDFKTSEDEVFDLSLTRLEEYVKKCKRCSLYSERKQAVFGTGVVTEPLLMVIGWDFLFLGGDLVLNSDNESSAYLEKVKENTAYLEAWLKSISLYKEKNTYVTDVIKCNCFDSREISANSEYVSACGAILKQQINAIKPQAVLALGVDVLGFLTGKKYTDVFSARGKIHFYDSMYPVFCTHRPDDVLKNMSLKRDVWTDLLRIAKYLDLEIVRK